MGQTDAAAAWPELCARFARLGAELGDDSFPNAPGQRSAGVTHLAEQVVCWLGWSVLHGDARRPAFHRQNDLVTPWGGPNADNVYRHARVDPARRYRVHGRMHRCEEFVLALRAGFMHQPVWGTLHQVTASDLGIGPGDEIDLVLGGPPAGRRWVPLPGGAVMASIREYYADWQAAEPAVLTIECLDDDVAGPLPPPDDAEVAARLDDATSAVEHSLRNWNRYLLDHRAAGTDNTIAPPMRVTKGLAEARYAFCFWDLAEDQALVVESTVPDARYWSLQLYELGWYHLIDPTERQSSLNHRQTAVDADGTVRWVIAHRDPGVANWLDAGGRRTGLATLRWFWAAADPQYSSRVVAVDDLAAELPGSPRVTAEQRRATLAARRSHLAWRFRT